MVSPVKDEEKYLETTIQAVAKQTLRPRKWILVDDGSRDGTPEILETYAAHFDWIEVLHLSRKAQRQPGSAVIQAFNAGYQLAGGGDFDFIVKLDCDLDLPADYFERLVRRFHENKMLGIASGVVVEEKRGRWAAVKMPSYHAVGASKMVRAKCFEDFKGFVPARGWDTVDEIRAQLCGWQTGHFRDLQILHLKPEGTGIGFLRTNVMHGEIYYVTGGGGLFFVLKLLHRGATGKPVLIGALAMLWGFLSAWAVGKTKLTNPSEARLYRRMLNRRLWASLKRHLALKNQEELNVRDLRYL
jgi:poly-beta-1,6-N-acetyl-D-glucosamine synthase